MQQVAYGVFRLLMRRALRFCTVLCPLRFSRCFENSSQNERSKSKQNVQIADDLLGWKAFFGSLLGLDKINAYLCRQLPRNGMVRRASTSLTEGGGEYRAATNGYNEYK